jgi:membrane fusion protein, heavy metal efflux system
LLRKDLQLAHAEMLREKQHVDTLKQRLILFGMPKAMVERVVSTSTITPFVPIVSPVAGSITAHQVAVGEIVSPDKKFMTVTDLSTVMMTADIPEVDVPQVRMGAPVEIKVSAFPQETFNGIISYVSDVVNPTTRTVAIRASLPNPHRKLKTNMWAEIDLPGAPASVLAVPKAAVQERAGSQVVYVATSGGYEEHRIEVGRDFGEYLEIKTGLREGDQVATQGSLLLRTAMTNRQTTEQ